MQIKTQQKRRPHKEAASLNFEAQAKYSQTGGKRLANNWRAIGKQLANNGKPVGKQLNGKSRFNIVSVDLILKPPSRRKALRTQGTNTAINSDLLHSDTLLLPFQAFANCLPIAWRLFACCSPTTRDLASHNISRNAKRALHHVSREAAAVGRSERLPRNAKPPLPLPLTTAQLSLNAPALAPAFTVFCFRIPLLLSLSRICLSEF